MNPGSVGSGVQGLGAAGDPGGTSREPLRAPGREQEVLLRSVPVGVAMVRERRVVLTNGALDRMFGHAQGEAVGMETRLFYADPVEYDRIGDESRERFREGRGYVTEARMRRRDGSELLCRLTGHPVESAEPDGASLWVLEDQTECQRMREALGERDRFLRRLGDNLPSGMIYQLTVDASGGRRFTYVSAGVERIHGLTAEEVMRDPLRLYGQIHEEDVERVRAREEESFRTRTPFSVECRVRDTQGRVRWVLLQSAPTVLPDGGVIWDGLELDITDRKRMEEQLVQAQRMEGVGRLAGGIAHEFNNILGAMTMTAGLLSMQEADLETRGLVTDLNGLVRRAGDLVGQLLAYSRQSVLQSEILELGPIVERQCEVLRGVLGENIRVETVLDGGVPPVRVDKTLVEQAILNLCLNARESMREGGGVLRLELSVVEVGTERLVTVPDASLGRHVCLSVSDTGPSLDGESLRRVFEPYFSAGGGVRGGGLGMAMVRGIVQQHGGWVEVESRAGRGTVFRAYFPPGTEGSGESDGVGVRVSGALGRPVVLVVEDDASLRRATAALLRRRGYEILEAPDAESGLALWALHRDRIEAVYTDMVMPGTLTGLDVVDRVLAERPGTRVLLTSGYHRDLVSANPAGGRPVVYLPKPCPPESLMRALESGGGGGGGGGRQA